MTTNYTLDLNSGLTQVLSDGTTTYTYGLGRIAQDRIPDIGFPNIHEESYFLGDALGSVRQLVSTSEGEVTFAQSYDPYGTVTSTAGTSQTAYGFTGEQYSAETQMVYLRARYYSPLDGRFSSRDTWGGEAMRPLSLNRWGYVEGNPVNFTDPTGLKVKEEGVRSGDFIYSCNCGWIDLSHASPTTSKEILNLLRINEMPPQGYNQEEKAIQLQIHTPYLTSFNKKYVVKTHPANNNKSLALGVLMNLENDRENLQGWIPWGGSYFSEEDLTSDLIGFYLGTNNIPSMREDAGFDVVVPICKIPPTRREAIEWSIKVFEEYGDSVEEWEKWANPRLECSSSINSFCGVTPRSWPTELSGFAAPEGEDWWKYSLWSDGPFKKSDINDNIFWLYDF